MASNRHQYPFRQTWREWFLEMAGSWKLLAVGVLLIAAVAAVALVVTEQPTAVEARVIRFGSYATEEGNQPLLLVRLRDGTVHQVRVHRANVKSCRVGGLARLMKRGSLLTLQPGGCVER